MVYDLEFRFGI